MQRIGETFEEPRRQGRWERNRYRHGAVFCRPEDVSTPLDRNARARLLYLAESLERTTKAPGRRNGCLGYVGLVVLRVLVLRFANSRTGACYPSITTICAATKLCRQAVCDALARLEQCGIITITRRIERTVVERLCAFTGQIQKFMTVVQAVNCYSFRLQAASTWAGEVEELMPAANARPFPQRRQREFFENLFLRLSGST